MPQFPIAIGLEDHAVTDDQHGGLNRREQMQPDGRHHQAEGKAGLRDLLGVREVADPYFHDLHAGQNDALGNLLRELGGHHVGAATQGCRLRAGIVVRVSIGDMP